MPGSFATEGILGQGFNKDNPIAAYSPLHETIRLRRLTLPGSATGDPDKAMEAVVDVVKGQGVANGKPWPFCLFLGEDAYRNVETRCQKVLAVLDEWKDVAQSMNFDEA